MGSLYSILLALLAASAAGLSRLSAQQANEKAARVLEPLLKRPASGPLFERFVNAWLDTGTLDDLGKFLTQRVQAEPSTPNRLLLALFLSRQGEPVQALEQFRVALTSDPGSADIWYQKALLESRTLDFEAAIASLGKCLAAKPAGELPLQASQLLGRLQARAGRTEEALKTWRALIESRPGDEELREDILELQIAESLWPAAQETAEALVEKTADPYRRVLRRMRLGDVLDRAGQRDKALHTFAACLADTGAGTWLEKEILSQIEKLFRREDDLSGLRAYFSKLLTHHAHRAGLQRALARLLMEAGETEAAIACGRALMALSPGDLAVREEFIALLTGAGRAAEAIPQVEQLLAQTPDDLELRLTLADLKHSAKDSAGALAALRDYGQRAGAKEGTALRLAGLMDRYGATDEAVKTLRAALENGGQPEARQMLAALLHKSGRKDEAHQEWQHLAASGTLPVIQQTARAMQAHGESGAAWELLRAAAPKAESDPAFLTQLCSLADSQERALAALPSARRLVELARSAPDLNSALDAAQRVVRLSGKADDFTADLTKSAASAPALCLLASLLEAARDTSGANAALEKARGLSPELALAQLVRLWSMRGDFAQAAAAAETWFHSPGGRQGHIAEMLASLHQRAGNPEAALRWMQEWRKLVPGAAAPVLGEARLLESLGRESEALAALRSAAGRFEGNEDIRARLAELSLDTGRTSEALRYYNTLYEEAPDLAARMRWLSLWGEAAQRAGQLESLITQFEERRRENRNAVAPLMALAELHRVADNYDARRNALTEAARLKPDDPEIALEIARLESRENDDEAAIRTLRPMLTKDPTGRVATLLSDLLISSGQLDEGLKLLTESTAASPAAVELAALSLARRDEEKSALGFLQPHLAKFPDDWRLHFLAALLEWRTGALDAAAARLISLTGASAPLARAGSTTATSSQSYEELVMRLMPPDVQRFFGLLQATADLNPGNNNQSGFGRQSAYTTLPADVEEVQERAAALLLELSKSATPEKREAWFGELERRGFTSARLVPELPALRRLQPADRYFDFKPLIQQFPNNRPIIALAGLATAYRQWNQPADAALAEKVWAALRTDAPLAGLFLCLPGAGQGKTRAPWEDEVLAAAEKLEPAPAILTMAVVRSGSLARDDDFPANLLKPHEEEWHRRMVTLLERWHAAADAGGIVRGYADTLRDYRFRALGQEYVDKKAAPALAALLESEWHWQSSRPQPAASTGSREELAQPLGFPPWFLPGLPDTLRDFLQRYLPAEVAAQTAPLVKEPLLRALVAAKAQGDMVAKAIQEAQPANATTAVPFILAASWAEKRGDFAAAGELAVKALYLPVSQEARRRLDGALAYWASKKAKPGDALYAAGREAALRLRRDAITPERRAELAALMDRLGLTDEADRLMRQGKAAGLAATTPEERLQTMLDEGRNREALPLLVSELRGWARQRLNYGSRPSDEPLMKWRTRVQANGLLSPVRQALLPAQPTAQHFAEYAAACELFGEPDQAREFYERALAGGVRKNVPRLLLILTYPNDTDRALQLLKEYPDLWALNEVRAWSGAVLAGSGHRATIENRISFADFLTRALDLLPEKYAAGFPAATLIELAGDDAVCGDFCTVQEVSWPSQLGFLRFEPPPEERKRVEALAATRDAACERLVRRLLLIPGCGIEAWQKLNDLTPYRKKTPGELLTDGMAMFVRELQVPAAKRPNQTVENQLERLCFQFIQEACRAGRQVEFAREVIPVVRSTRSPKTAEAFLEAWPLYETPPEKFAETARAMFKARGSEIWPGIIEAAVLRKLGADLEPDFLTHFSRTEDIRERNDSQFGAWCGILEAAQGRAGVEKFVRAVMESLLGPVADRAKLPDSERLASARRILGSLAELKDWTGFSMRFYRDEILLHLRADERGQAAAAPFPDQFLSRPLSGFLQVNDYAGAKAWLDSLPLTEDVETFWAGGDEALLELQSVLSDVKEDQRRELGLDRHATTLTFGRRVLRGMAAAGSEGHEDERGLFAELAGTESRIEALPEPARTRLLDTLRKLAPAQRPASQPEAQAFRAWLMKEQDAKEAEELDKSIAEFLTKAGAGGFESEEALVERMKSLVSSMAPTRHPRGREVVLAAHAAAEKLGARDQRSLLLEGLLEQICDTRGFGGGTQATWPNHNPAWQCGLLATLLKAGEPAEVAYISEMDDIGNWVRALPFADIPGLLDSYIAEAGANLQPGEARLLMPWAMRMVFDGSRREQPDYTTGVQWVESLRGKCPHEELRLEMEMALRLHAAGAAGKKAQGQTDEAALPAEQRHYLALLRDAGLPAPLRLAIAVSLLNMTTLEPPLVLETARQLRQALADRQPVTPEQEAAVFTALHALPAAAVDDSLLKSLLSLTTLPRLRNDSRGSEGLPQLLDFALRAGDFATADRLLELEGAFPGMGALTVLARHGQKQRIADLRKKRPELVWNASDDMWAVSRYDAALAAQLPAVLEGIADAELRFEMLSRLTVQPDADPFPPDLKPHTARCAGLATAFTSTSWRSPAVRDRVMGLMASWNEPPPEVLAPLWQESARRVPASALPFLDTGSTVEVEIHALLAARALASGDPQPLLDILQALENSTAPREDYVISVRATFLAGLHNRLLTLWPTMTADQRAAACAGFRKVLTQSRTGSWRDAWAGQVPRVMLLHALAGQMDAFTAWHAALSATDHALLRYLLDKYSPGDALDQLQPHFDNMPEGKAALLHGLFTALAVNPLGCGPGAEFDSDFLSVKGATPEEFLKLEEPLTSARPDDGWLAAAFARVHAAGGAWDKALARTAAALTKVKPERGSAYAVLLELRVQALEKLGRGGEALAEVKALLSLALPATECTGLASDAEVRLARSLADKPH